ncbi:hypothetical protein [Acetomicrobium sp.]|uniref:hypothetical protein n=1 Tax=Acetomicrobium sp. TaxID=1872099 RepID=UPI002FCA5E2D
MTPSFIVSLKVLIIDVPILFFMGTLIGWTLAKKQFKGRTLVDTLVVLPIVLPPSVLGLYLLMTLSHIPFIRESRILFLFRQPL